MKSLRVVAMVLALVSGGVVMACGQTYLDGVLPISDAGVDAQVNCRAGEVVCGLACAFLSKDPIHCGACDNACASGRVCSQGTCANECSGGSYRVRARVSTWGRIRIIAGRVAMRVRVTCHA